MTRRTIRLRSILNAEQLQALGQISADFQLLEETMSSFILDLIGAEPDVAEIITSELSFRKLVDLLSALFKHQVRNERKIVEMERLLARANSVAQKRNIIIHSGWAWGKTEGTVTRLKTTAKQKHGLRVQAIEMNTAMLKQIADEIAEVSADLVEFHRTL
jgi:hypothetical protein